MQHAALTPVFPQYVAALCGQAGLCFRAATPRRANIPLYRLTIYAWPGQDAHPNSQRPWLSEKRHSNRGNVLDRSWILRMHCAARAWPLNETPPLTGTSSGEPEERGYATQEGQRATLVVGWDCRSAACVHVSTATPSHSGFRQLLCIPIQRKLLFSQFPTWFFMLAESGF